MWRKSKKWLSFLLAFTLSFGDFLPAMAAAPESTAEVTEAPAEQEDVTEEADAQETPEEAPDKSEEKEEAAEPSEEEETVSAGMEDQGLMGPSEGYVDKGELESWSGTITVPAGEYWYYTYQPTRVGNYIAEYKRDEAYSNIATEDPQASGGIYDVDRDKEYTYNGISFAGRPYKNDEPFTFATVEVYLQNPSSEDQVFTLKTDEDYTSQELTVGEKADLEPSQNYQNLYYTFTAPYDGVYGIHWDGGVWPKWAYKTAEPEKGIGYNDIPLKTGETVKYCVGAGNNIGQTPIFVVNGEEAVKTEGDSLNIFNEYVLFTPTKTSNYAVKTGYYGIQCYNEETEGWDNISGNGDTGERHSIYLEQGKEYWLRVWSDDREPLRPCHNVVILDYDYFKAYTTMSGGAVTVGENNQITIDSGSDGTVMDRLKEMAQRVISIMDVDSYSKDYKDEFDAGNVYWRSEESGAFEANEFFRIKSSKGALQEITGKQLADVNDEVLVVRYVPDIIWVGTVNITTEDGSNLLEVGDTLQLRADPRGETDKYPYSFKEDPKIRWESSDPDIAEVDPDTGLVTAKKLGKVTINAYADEELRAVYIAKGMDMPKYTKESIDLEVVGEKKAFPLTEGVSVRYFKNINGTTTVGEVKEALAEQLDRDAEEGYTGTFTFETGDWGYDHYDETEAPVGTSTWKVIYKPGKNDIYAGAETTVTVDYGTLDMKVTAADGTTLSATKCGGTKIAAKPHPSETVLQVELSYNGKTISAEELSKSGYTLGDVKLSTGAEGVLDTDNASMTVTGLGAGTDSVKVEVPVSVTGTDKTATLAQTLDFIVKDESVRAVKSIDIKKADGTEVPKMLKAEDVADQKVEIPLALTMKDFAGADYSDAKVAWTTSDKSVASVTVAKDGTSTLVIPKKASGIAELTVTSKDYNKASASFRIIVADADVRILNTTVTTNSVEDDYATIQIAPNALWAEAMGIDEDNLVVEVFPVVAEQYAKFELIGEGYNGREGSSTVGAWYHGVLVDTNQGGVGIRYKDPNEKAGKTTLTLGIACYDKTKTPYTDEFKAASMTVTKTITIVNKPVYPKATMKVTQNYNTFWNNDSENAYAKVVLTTEGNVGKNNTDPAPQALNATATGPITLEENDSFELVNVKSYEENQWTITLKAKNGETPKKAVLTFDVEYFGYREPAKIKATVNVSRQTPTFNLVTEANSTAFYPELGETDRIVLMKVPEGIKAEDIDLTAASKKNFEVTNKEIVDADKMEEKLDGIEGSVAVLEISYKTDKSADLQFAVTSDQFAKENTSVTSKKLRLTAKKLSAEKLQVCDDATGEAKTAYNLQQQMAGKELLTLAPQMPNLAGYNDAADYDVYSWRMEVEAGNTFTADMTESKYLNVQPINEGRYWIWGTPDLFNQKTGNCVLKCTFYATSENGDQEEHVVKVVNIRLNLQKQKQAPKITATVKASNALNVVDYDKNHATLTPIFKNLPYGAKVTGVALASDTDAELYDLDYDKESSDGKATLWTKTTDTPIPLGTDKIDLEYTIYLIDGKTKLTVPATVAVNVTQTATVKIAKKSVTLYNGALGGSYGDVINLTVPKPENANIRSIEIPDLDETGIKYDVWIHDNEGADILFYLDSPQLTKSYKARIIVHLDGAGSRKGKEVTYDIPVTVTVKK